MSVTHEYRSRGLADKSDHRGRVFRRVVSDFAFLSHNSRFNKRYSIKSLIMPKQAPDVMSVIGMTVGFILPGSDAVTRDYINNAVSQRQSAVCCTKANQQNSHHVQDHYSFLYIWIKREDHKSPFTAVPHSQIGISFYVNSPF